MFSKCIINLQKDEVLYKTLHEIKMEVVSLLIEVFSVQLSGTTGIHSKNSDEAQKFAGKVLIVLGNIS